MSNTVTISTADEFVEMSADEFAEWQEFLGLSNHAMAKALGRHDKSISNYRQRGVTDYTVYYTIMSLVAQMQARIFHEDCIMKCGAKAEDNSPYCAACSAEARSEWQ